LEAQELWEKFNGQTSALIPGTTAYKYAKGKRLLQMHQNQAQTLDRLIVTLPPLQGSTALNNWPRH
jgi:hypothetical protein